MGYDTNKTAFSLKKYHLPANSGIYVALVTLCIIATIASPKLFLSLSNLSNVLRQASIVGVVSIGMTIVLLVGGIDLSVTSTMALSACLMARIFEKMADKGLENLSFLLVIGILAIGALIGLLNGLMIVYRGMEPFIITLGMMQVLRGINYIYTHGAPGGSVTGFWKSFGSGSLAGIIPWPALFFILLLAAAAIVLKRTIFGRYTYAIGSNSEAARLSGIKVKKYKVSAYVICGITAAMAGVMLAARVRVGEPNGSNGYDLDSIAAVVIGGTAMAGGTGTMVGTLAGVLIMAIMNNILNLVNADPYLQIVIKGLIVLVAVLSQRKNKTA